MNHELMATLEYQYKNGQMEQDVHDALGAAIASMAAWDRVTQRIKMLENDCILGLDADKDKEAECKKCKLNTFWSVRKLIQEELELAKGEVENGDNS